MVIGRWSEFSLVWADQVKEGRRWAGARETSGEEQGEFPKGRRVGESAFRAQKSVESIAEASESPRGSLGSRGEYQLEW
jgi:hypothetical protein